jgi:hypothetical protein
LLMNKCCAVVVACALALLWGLTNTRPLLQSRWQGHETSFRRRRRRRRRCCCRHKKRNGKVSHLKSDICMVCCAP